MFQDPKKINSENNKLAFSKFLSEVDAGRVVEVQIQGNNISGVLSDGKNLILTLQIIQSLLINFHEQKCKHNRNTSRR